MFAICRGTYKFRDGQEPGESDRAVRRRAGAWLERELSAERLAEQWTLDATDWEWLANKSGATRLGFAALLKFFAAVGRFPRERDEVPASAVEFLAGQVRVPAAAWLEYRWEGRTFEYHRAQVREALGYREAAAADAEMLAGWLRAHWLARERNPDRLKEAATVRCRELRIEPPAPDRMNRLVRSAAAGFEEQFCRELMAGMPERTRQKLDSLLLATAPDIGRVELHALRADPGPASIETLEEELGKLNRLRGLNLPAGLFSGIAPAIVELYRREPRSHLPAGGFGADGRHRGAAPGRKPFWSGMSAGKRASTGSPTRSASCSRYASACARRSCGSKEPTGTATRTRICRGISRGTATPITERSGCRAKRTCSWTGSGASSGRRSPGSTAASGKASTSASLRRMAGGSPCLRFRRRPSRPISIA